MADQDSTKVTIFALGGALVLTLLAIAFLLGRESARRPSDPEPVVVAETPYPPIVQRADEEDAAEVRPDWRELDRDEGAANATDDTIPGMGERIERQADGTFLLTNSGSDREIPAEEQDAQPRAKTATVSAYFRELDLIRSNEGAGDPNVFAMGLIKAGLGGATSGFDQLIEDTKRMEQEMRQIRPPQSCEQYHQASLEALAEGRELLEELKTAITKQDIEGLGAMARRAGELQAKAQSIDEMRAKIEASRPL